MTTATTSRARGRGAGLLTAIAIGRRIERQGDERSRLPGILAIVAFAVATAALLVTLAGVHAFSQRAGENPDLSAGTMYLSLAFAAAGMLIAPILTLGGVAARLTLGRRDQRLAALRLAGATRGQVSAITLAETGRLAAAGALAGLLLYAVSIPALRPLRFEGRPFEPSELVLPWWWLPVVPAGVVALALGSGMVSLRRVAIDPLGVAARHTPRPMRMVRVLMTAAAVLVWLVIAKQVEHLGTAVLMVIMAALVAVLNVIGPFVMMLIGHVTAASAHDPRTLIAARRLADDPRAAWRSVGSLGLAITVAGLAGTAASLANGADAQASQVLIDMRTGALVTLGIIAVISATSTGVVQAARIIDRRAELRMLTLAGADPRDLLTAARREVTLPLITTAGMACIFCLVIIGPTASVAGFTTYFWMSAAVAVSVALMLAAVRATAPLVRSAARHE